MDYLLKSIFDTYEYKNKSKNDFSSFLSIIGRTYDEDLLSRIVAYALSVDKTLVLNLFSRYSQKKSPHNVETTQILNYDIDVACEKFMGKGRADIFIEIKNKNEIVATITIENKIYSVEHDDQTQTYFDWVTQNPLYKENCFNMFFYLRPAFNHSEAVCKEYVNITYTDLLYWIEADDYIIKDFKHHINKKLGDIDMSLNENQIDIIDNYEKIYDAINEARYKFVTYKNDILEKIRIETEKQLQCKIFDCKSEEAKTPGENDYHLELASAGANMGTGSFRIYKPTWYSADRYYAYVEIKMEGGKFDKITFQQTIKGYAKNDNLIQDILTKTSVHVLEKSDRHYVVKLENYGDVSSHENLSWKSGEPWEQDFITKASEKMAEYIKDMYKNIAPFLS